MYFQRLAAALLSVVLLQSWARGEPVRVVLRGAIQPNANVVAIDDVARISGGDLIKRRTISGLDLLVLDNSNDTKRVSKQQVSFRILFAGISAEDFEVVGPDFVIIRRDSTGPAFEQRLLEFLRPHVAERVGADSEDVVVRLIRPIPENSETQLNRGMQLEHFLPATIRSDSLTTRIGIKDGARLVRTIPVSIDIQVSRPVLVAKQRIQSGATISADDVVREERLVSVNRADTASLEAIIGKSTKTDLPQGAIITARDVKRASPKRREIVIRSRDVVEVVARRKTLQVRLVGAVALDSGAVGDMIRVKKPNSKTTLTAQVVSAGRVQIQL